MFAASAEFLYPRTVLSSELTLAALVAAALSLAAAAVALAATWHRTRALQQRVPRPQQQWALSRRFGASSEAPCSWSGVWRVPRVTAAQAAFALEPTSVSHAVVPLSFRFAVVRLSFRSAVVSFSVLAPLWCFCLVALM